MLQYSKCEKELWLNKYHSAKQSLNKSKCKCDLLRSVNPQWIHGLWYVELCFILVVVKLKQMLEKVFSCLSSKWCKGWPRSIFVHAHSATVLWMISVSADAGIQTVWWIKLDSNSNRNVHFPQWVIPCQLAIFGPWKSSPQLHVCSYNPFLSQLVRFLHFSSYCSD